MAATKRKPSRSTARKAAKKPMAMKRKSPAKGKARKARSSASSAKKGSLKVVRSAPVTRIDRPYTKGQLFTTLAGRTGMNRRDIAAIFDELSPIIQAHLKGPGNFTIPGLAKLTVIRKPATKAREGINPFTGERMMFKAKPARNVVKARALKKLKEMV